MKVSIRIEATVENDKDYDGVSIATEVIGRCLKGNDVLVVSEVSVLEETE